MILIFSERLFQHYFLVFSDFERFIFLVIDPNQLPSVLTGLVLNLILHWVNLNFPYRFQPKLLHRGRTGGRGHHIEWISHEVVRRYFVHCILTKFERNSS